MKKKNCTKCKKYKPLSEFYKHEYHKDKHSSRCKQCNLAVQRAYRENNRKEYNARAREYHHKHKDRQRNGKLKSNYNMTLEQKQKLYLNQNGCCLICKRSVGFNKICVDHCHKTTKVRALLCNKCNLGIGLLNHDPKILISAANYLERL